MPPLRRDPYTNTKSPKSVCQSVCQHLILRSTGYTFLPINHFERFGKQITLCESLSSFSQFLPVPDTGLLNPTSLRKPLNSACTTLHKPLKTPIRCLRTPHLHETFDKAIRVIHFRSPIFYSGSFYRNQAPVCQFSLSYDNRRNPGSLLCANL